MSHSAHRPNVVWAVAIGLAIVVAVALRWYDLSGESLWYDEGFTAWVVSLSPAEIVQVSRADTSPPLYYLLLHGWTRVFGGTELSLRGFSALCATLTIPVVALIAVRLTGSRRGILAALAVVAFSVLQVRYAREARCYALLSLLSAIQFHAMLVFRDNRSWLAAARAILAGAAMLYTHNMMLVYVACAAVAFVVLPSRRTVRGRVFDAIVALLAMGVLYLPWLDELLAQVRRVDGAFWVPVPSSESLLRMIQSIYGGRADYATNALVSLAVPAPVGTALGWSAIAMLVIAMLALLTGRRRPRLDTLAVLMCALLPVVAIYLYSRLRTPLFIDRVFVPSSVLCAVLPGMLLSRWRAGSTRSTAGGMTVLLVLFAATSSIGFVGFERKEDWRSATRFIESIGSHSTRVIVFVGNEGQLLYSYYRDASRGDAPHLTGLPEGILDHFPPRPMSYVRQPRDLQRLPEIIEARGAKEVVLVVCHGTRDPQKLGLSYLRENCRVIEKRDFHEVAVWRFDVTDRPLARVE